MNVKCPDCGQPMFIYDPDTLSCKNGHRYPSPQMAEEESVGELRQSRLQEPPEPSGRVPLVAVAVFAGAVAAAVFEIVRGLF